MRFSSSLDSPGTKGRQQPSSPGRNVSVSVSGSRAPVLDFRFRFFDPLIEYELFVCSEVLELLYILFIISFLCFFLFFAGTGSKALQSTLHGSVSFSDVLDAARFSAIVSAWFSMVLRCASFIVSVSFSGAELVAYFVFVGAGQSPFPGSISETATFVSLKISVSALDPGVVLASSPVFLMALHFFTRAFVFLRVSSAFAFFISASALAARLS